MTRTALYLILLATLGGQVGCAARLTVSVDIYNGAMRKLQYAQNLIAIADAVSAGVADACKQDEPSQPANPTKGDAKSASSSSKNRAWENFSARIATQLAPSSRSVLASVKAEDQGTIIANFEKNVCEQKDTILRKRKELLDCIQSINNGEAYLAANLESRLSALESALATMRNASIEFENKTKKMKDNNGVSVNLSLDWGRLTGQGVAVAGSASTENNVVGYPIFDRLIPLIANDRGKGIWVNYSKNCFTAVGGDAQFVVVRDGLVVFHQKSLDFDPTPVVGAGTAVARLGLKVAAAIAAGMSGGAAGSLGNLVGGGGSKPSDSGSGSTDPETKRQILRQREAAKLMLLQDLAEMYRRTPSNGNKEELAKLRQQLQGLINHYEASLALPAAP